MVLTGGVGAGRSKPRATITGPSPWPCPRAEVGAVAAGICHLHCPTAPSTGPTLGGRRGGVRALEGGSGSEGWAMLQNLPGNCPHHATLSSQAEPTHTLWERAHRWCGCPGRSREKERTGISATPLPDASPVGPVGVGADGEPPWSFRTPLSRPSGCTSRPGSVCTEVRCRVCACTRTG